MSRAKFKARIVVEEEFNEVEVWDDELSPFGKDGKCSIREWVKVHFDNFNNETLREVLGLPATGNFEALLEGTIIGTTDPYSNEYDEEVEVDKIQTQPIPDSWYSQFFPGEL